MAKTQIVAGLELGSSKIATIIAQVSQDPTTLETNVNVVGAASVESSGIRKGQIVDIEEVVEATVASVEAAERMAGYGVDSALISISGAHVTSQNTHGVVAISDPDGEISIDDAERVIEAASAISLPSSREIIHVLPREFIVDGEAGVKTPVGMNGVRLEVETHMVTASAAAIKNLRKALDNVGVNIEELVFSGFASSEAVLTSTEKELGCVVVDIGGGTTSIAAFIDGALTYSGVTPIGSRNVTNDLAIGLRVSLDAAERIKIVLSEDAKPTKKKEALEREKDDINLQDIGIAEARKVSKKTLSEGIIRPRLNEIFTMVRLELEKVNVSNRVPSGVIITGGGAETVGAVDSARRMLSLPVRVGVPQGIGGLVDDILAPAFATPVGLILYAAQSEPVENLSSFARRIKLPSGGLTGRLIELVKDLLP